MPANEAKGILNDIGVEELGHMEMIGSIVHQLTKDVPVDVLEKEGMGGYFVDHGYGIYPVNASGVAYDANSFAVKGDPVADLVEDLAAEQKARATYEHLIQVSDDPDVIDPLRFLRAREVVHFQRFGEALRIVQDRMMQKNCYVLKPDDMCKN